MKFLKLTGLLLIMGFSCFSQSYPPYTVSVYDTASSGFYFTLPVNIGFNPSAIPPTHMILDDKGRVVYYKNFVVGVPTGDFKLQPNGLMSYSRQNKFYLMDSTFMIIDTVACPNGVLTDTHDFLILPNGNFLILGYENEQMDLSSYYLFGPNNVPGSATANVICGVIQELDSNKNVVFEWHAKDHFLFEDVDEAWLINPNNVDWTHCNAVEMDADGNLLLSSRHFNEITKINRQTGGIMWRMGGNANQFVFINDSMQFKRQHDIRRLTNGNISLFDNGESIPGNPLHFSAAKEYQIDEVNFTATLVWSYTDNYLDYSRAMGNFQRRPGGNSLICYGNNDIENTLFQAVSETGQVIMELYFNDSLRAYRSFNYPTLPWSLNRPQITCFGNGSTYYLDAGPGHASYQWSNGSTTQVISVTDTGSYSVFVPVGMGGFISSETFDVISMADPCGLTGLTEDEAQSIIIYPNPFLKSIIVETGKPQNEQFDIFNSTGQLIFSGTILPGRKNTFDMENLGAGVYFFRKESLIKKIIKY
jgi:hypothetical protein